MASWFNNLAAQITEALPALPEAPDTLIPVTKNDIINALTFQTPEMVTERKRIDLEERRKEGVKEALSRVLPWETNNEDQEILVEECRESILALSSMAGAGEEKSEDDKEAQTSIFQQPFGCGDLEGELRAMEALEDYPRLLRVFDLDAHVGLIQRLFDVDKNLVEMHSQLSGAGEIEYNFWKNYFYHCAFARQKIGMSNSEIWDQTVAPKVASATPNKVPSKSDDKNDSNDSGSDDEGSITFESAPEDSATVSSNSTTESAPAVTTKPNTSTDTTKSTPASTAPRERSPEKDYEIVNAITPNTKVDNGNESDLDDLEAEIARELAG